MSAGPEKQKRAKEIRLLLARWKKTQRSKQAQLPFLKAKTAFQHHFSNHPGKKES